MLTEAIQLKSAILTTTWRQSYAAEAAHHQPHDSDLMLDAPSSRDCRGPGRQLAPRPL
jgi:hypothetical protein